MGWGESGDRRAGAGGQAVCTQGREDCGGHEIWAVGGPVAKWHLWLRPALLWCICWLGRLDLWVGWVGPVLDPKPQLTALSGCMMDSGLS